MLPGWSCIVTSYYNTFITFYQIKPFNGVDCPRNTSYIDDLSKGDL